MKCGQAAKLRRIAQRGGIRYAGVVIRRLIALAALTCALSACSTTREVEGTAAITGRELDAATALYGPWDQKLLVNDQPVYIWRRHMTASDGRNYYCELRVEMGWKQVIGRALTHGYPGACALFKVKFESHVK